MAVRDRFCRKIHTYLVIFGHFRSLSIRKSVFVNIFWFGLDNQSTREPKQVQDIYTIYWPPCWRTKEFLQHGGSILRSVILRGTFQRISQLWDNARSLNLEDCLLYLSSTISQLFDFVRCVVFFYYYYFIFYCVTVHTLYSIRNSKIFAVGAYVLQNMQNLVISRFCLAKNGNEMYKEL